MFGPEFGAHYQRAFRLGAGGVAIEAASQSAHSHHELLLYRLFAISHALRGLLLRQALDFVEQDSLATPIRQFPETFFQPDELLQSAQRALRCHIINERGWRAITLRLVMTNTSLFDRG
jgi:hypothetical protein